MKFSFAARKHAVNEDIKPNKVTTFAIEKNPTGIIYFTHFTIFPIN